MTDRELLELAAKACGYKWSSDVAKEREQRGVIGLWIPDVSTFWNPLTSDGDALRLAVKLNLDIRYDTCDCGVEVTVFGNYDDTPAPVREEYEREPEGYAATRRAIVRAAAEIGKGEQSQEPKL